ncbi:unnamed protein product [Polarella glacialis]|uniref:J domain-containing protein n=1 Tax=Polarella glacialis TaxID=89957 RepID=A0A813JXG9_POLGL|nr:unnamed protein product [Polarella glacialis]
MTYTARTSIHAWLLLPLVTRRVPFFDLLGVSTTVGLTELRAAFRRCALAAHPDKGGSNEAFQEVFCAFEVLSDVDQRKNYLQLLLKSDAADASSLIQQWKRRSQGGDGYMNGAAPQGSEEFGRRERKVPPTKRKASADAQNPNNNNNSNKNNKNNNNNCSEKNQVTKEQESSRLNRLFVLLEELSPGNKKARCVRMLHV